MRSKIVINHTDIPTLALIAKHGIDTPSKDVLFNWMWQTYLQRFMLKLIAAKQKRQKQYTIPIEPGEAMCYQWAIEQWQQDKGTDYETTVGNSKVLQPIIKQLTAPTV